MDFFNPLSDSIEMLSTVVAEKGPAGLGSCWEGGCGLPSVENHDLV